MRYIVLFIASLLCKYSFAQHCPFDGAHLIAVKAVGKNGKMMKSGIPVFYLKEVDNSMADSCTSSPGLIKKQILTATQFKTDCNIRYDRNGYNATLKNRLTKAGVFVTANGMININQGEKPFTFMAMMLSVKYNDIDIWRVGSGYDINQYPREPFEKCMFIISEIVFENN